MNVNFILKIHRACFYHRLIERSLSQKNGDVHFLIFSKLAPRKNMARSISKLHLPTQKGDILALQIGGHFDFA